MYIPSAESRDLILVQKEKNHSVLFSCEKQLYKRLCPSVGPSVGPSVMLSVTLLLFGLLGATNAVFTALLFRILLFTRKK